MGSGLPGDRDGRSGRVLHLRCYRKFPRTRRANTGYVLVLDDLTEVLPRAESAGVAGSRAANRS